jgi:SOS response regulatory protein OraA/RecX
MKLAGYSSEEIDEALAFLHEKGYLNDAAFALDVARASASRKHWGPARVQKKLEELKLSDRHIEDALRQCFPEGEEARSAERTLERFRKRGGPSGLAGRARAYRHLLGRGFSPEVARRLVSTDDFGDTETS